MRLLEAARLFAADAGLAHDAADRLAIVVEEWAANVVEHSAAPPGSLIILRLERTQTGIVLTFTDAGVAFDPRAAAQKGPNLQRGGGAGIALIRAWSEVDYQRTRGRNRLVLRSRS